VPQTQPIRACLFLTIAPLFVEILGAGRGLAQPALHEPVPAPALRCDEGLCRREGERSGLPDAVLGEDGLIGAPLGSREPQQHEQIFSSSNQASPLSEELLRGAPPPGHDPPPLRRGHVAPDADTGMEAPGERVYHEVFNPAVFPYKRMSALDAVDEEGALYVADTRHRELPAAASRLQPGRDPFYGSLVVDFVAGKPVALPTPAAGVRLLSYQATPALPLYFFLDGADNLYVMAARSGRHRLVYLVDAEQRYFSGPLLPASVRRRGVRMDALPAAPRLPHWLRRDADLVLRHIGVRAAASNDYTDLLGRLVAYFRAFRIEELADSDDESRSSLYRRIALSQRGVCRHRAYAFVITALAAGIPARYVENELHVFVEVYIPPAGGSSGYWRRINLGGAPLQQRVYGGESREAYREKGSDPFERPSAFAQGPQPQVAGLPKRQAQAALSAKETRREAVKTPSSPPNVSNSSSALGNGAGETSLSDGSAEQSRPSAEAPQGAFSGTGGSGTRTTSGGEQEGGDSDPATSGAVDSVEQPTDTRGGSTADGFISTRVTMTVGAGRRIYRGTAVPIRGQVQAAHGSAANMEVILLLAVAQRPLILGRTVTRSDGSFETEVEIPAAAPLGHYQVVARVRGDEARRGSSSGHYDRLSRTATSDQDFMENK